MQVVSLFWLSGSGSANAAHRMLVKLTRDVNFTNILYTAFILVDPESLKNSVKYHQYLLTLLVSASIKAVSRMLVKLIPGLNFINILRTAFTLVDPKSIKRLTT